MKKERFPKPAAPRLDALEASELLDIQDEDEIESLLVSNVSFDVQAGFVEITTSRFEHASFTSCEFDKLSAIDVVFEDCELSAASIQDASLKRTEFRQCRMSGLNIAGTKFRDVVFVACKLDQANLRDCEFERCLFVDCDLRDASFNESRFIATQIRDCNLERGEFSFVMIEDLALHGSQLHDLQGVGHLRNAVIGSDQVMPLAAALITHTGIEINDEI